MSLYIATIEISEDKTTPNKNGDMFIGGFPRIKSIRKMGFFDKILNWFGIKKYPKCDDMSKLPKDFDEADMIIEVPGPIMKLMHGTDGQYTKVCRCVAPAKVSRGEVKPV